jgi:hypothetical protein
MLSSGSLAVPEGRGRHCVLSVTFVVPDSAPSIATAKK